MANFFKILNTCLHEMKLKALLFINNNICLFIKYNQPLKRGKLERNGKFFVP